MESNIPASAESAVVTTGACISELCRRERVTGLSEWLCVCFVCALCFSLYPANVLGRKIRNTRFEASAQHQFSSSPAGPKELVLGPFLLEFQGLERLGEA